LNNIGYESTPKFRGTNLAHAVAERSISIAVLTRRIKSLLLMPIKPENKKLYPANWPQISRRIRVGRANNYCEVCGVRNYSVGYRINGEFHYLSAPPFNHPAGFSDFMAAIEITWHYNDWCDQDPKAIVIVLTVAHLDHNPENCADNNLLCMCQRCHNIYDRPHRNETMHATRKKGQLELKFT
jgi:hypothetical protein